MASVMFADDNDDWNPPNRVMQWWVNFGSGCQTHIVYQDEGSGNIPSGQRTWTWWPSGSYTGRAWTNQLMIGKFVPNAATTDPKTTIFDCPSFKQPLRTSNPPRSNCAYGQNMYNTARQNGIPALAGGANPNSTAPYSDTFYKMHTAKYGSINNPERSWLYMDRTHIVTPDEATGAHWSDSPAITMDNTLGNAGFEWNNPVNFGAAWWSHKSGINLSTFDGAVHWLSREEAAAARTSNAVWVSKLTPGVYTSGAACEFNGPVW